VHIDLLRAYYFSSRGGQIKSRKITMDQGKNITGKREEGRGKREEGKREEGNFCIFSIETFVRKST
jgi:hypothetical protein